MARGHRPADSRSGLHGDEQDVGRYLAYWKRGLLLTFRNEEGAAALTAGVAHPGGVNAHTVRPQLRLWTGFCGQMWPKHQHTPNICKVDVTLSHMQTVYKRWMHCRFLVRVSFCSQVLLLAVMFVFSVSH